MIDNGNITQGNLTICQKTVIEIKLKITLHSCHNLLTSQFIGVIIYTRYTKKIFTLKIYCMIFQDWKTEPNDYQK